MQPALVGPSFNAKQQARQKEKSTVEPRFYLKIPTHLETGGGAPNRPLWASRARYPHLRVCRRVIFFIVLYLSRKQSDDVFPIFTSLTNRLTLEVYFFYMFVNRLISMIKSNKEKRESLEKQYLRKNARDNLIA